MPAITILLGTVGVIYIVLNWSFLIASLVRKEHYPLVSWFGGVILFVGLLLDPAFRHMAWIGLVVDIGFWTLVFAVPYLIAEQHRVAKLSCND